MTGLGFKDFFSRLSGAFAAHIEQSIPGYAENRARTAYVLSTLLPHGATVADIGASEGQFLNALCTARPDVHGENVDPNPAMRKAWQGVEGTSYRVEAWKDGFQDGEEYIPAYAPAKLLDAVHMSMVRQFVTDDAAGWYGEAARLLAPTGLFIVNTKVIATPGHEEAWHAKEAAKDAYKLQYFTQEEVTRKAEETLVGMHSLMVSYEEELAALRSAFAHVAPYWESYNFHGFIASNDAETVRGFLARQEASHLLHWSQEV